MDETPPYDITLVKGLARKIARQYHLSEADTEDLEQEVHLKLLENGRRRLAQFEGRCRLSTFLHVAVRNEAFDFLDKRGRRIRTTAGARKLGKPAEELELLMFRDRHSRHEAVQILLSRNEYGLTEQELTEMAVQLRVRYLGPRETGDIGDNHADPGRADDDLLQAERGVVVAGLRESLMASLRELDPEHQLMIRMRYWSRLTIRKIDEVLSLEGHGYEVFRNILDQLRTSLEARGVSLDDVTTVLGSWEWWDCDNSRGGDDRPSNSNDGQPSRMIQ